MVEITMNTQNKKDNHGQFFIKHVYNFLNALKARFNVGVVPVILLLVAIQVIYVLRILPVNVIISLKIFETVFSIYISYKHGYLGAVISIIMNVTSIGFIYYRLLTTGDLLYLDNFASRISIIIASVIISYFVEEQNKHIKELESSLVVDGLTGIHNHRYFNIKLEEEIKRAQKNKSTLSLVMVDIDNLKRYNDTEGHEAGDMLIRKAAVSIKMSLRVQDTVCRYVSDEFSILLPNASSNDILELTELIRRKFAESAAMDQKENTKNMTLSFGYSIYPAPAGNRDELISQAEEALYNAKNLGRNSIEFFKDAFLEIETFLGNDDRELTGGLKALLGIVSTKDKYTFRHSERVLDYAVTIGKNMGLPEERIKLLKTAALFHDIGKVQIPESILNKRGPLSEKEYELIKKHPIYSVNILEPILYMDSLIDAVRYHHERYDGKGYPDGISGDDIPLEARILCVADSFDAMLSDRPYRKSMGLEKALQELKRCSGTQFDPKIADVFIKILESKKMCLN